MGATDLSESGHLKNSSAEPTSALQRGLSANVPGVEVGWYLRPFMLCGLPLRKPPGIGEDWIRWDAQAHFRAVPDARYGIPYGQDRLVLVLLATRAMEQNRRRIKLGSAYQILQWFGLPPDGRNYARLAERFNRVLGTRTLSTYWTWRSGKRVVLRRSRIYYRDVQLWTQQKGAGIEQNLRHFENSLRVSEGFWDELSRSPGQADMNIIRTLAGSPGNLAFYLWLITKSQAVWPDHVLRVPIFGKAGLNERLGAAGYAQKRDFRRRARNWLSRIGQLWNDCPAEFSENSESLIVRNTPRFVRSEQS